MRQCTLAGKRFSKSADFDSLSSFIAGIAGNDMLRGAAKGRLNRQDRLASPSCGKDSMPARSYRSTPTLEQLQRRATCVFAEAREVIKDAHRIHKNAKDRHADVRRSIDDFTAEAGRRLR